jgi:hypothetical protein
MKLQLPSPAQCEVMRTFLAESTDLHIEHVAFNRLSSGVCLTVHYRDARDFSHKKHMSAPDARNDNDITDLVVLMSEWLTHPTTVQQDMLQTAGNC